ncbi:MAG: CysS/YqeB C-terminal domain-containing protein [Actinomycetota bacterium]
MTKVHRELLDRLGPDASAVLLDTPVGFQMNADEVSARAVSYFRVSLNRELKVASYKSAAGASAFEYESMLEKLRDAAYVFSGPGSPTYALRQWRSSAVPDVLREKLRTGGCISFASAAALTLGRLTLPVYEIYKVGEDVRWEDGLDVLSETGLNAVVITHYDNREGGTHDTRYCYMGETRLRELEDMLPDDVFILGIDEHTACILDLESDTATVEGLGTVTIRRKGTEASWPTGSTAPLGELDAGGSSESGPRAAPFVEDSGADPFWSGVAPRADAFDNALSRDDVPGATNALLELEEHVRTWSTETFGTDDFDRGREVLRRMIVQLGEATATRRASEGVVAPLVEALLAVRERARLQERWDDADLIRDALLQHGIEIHDGPHRTSWDFRAER